MTKLEKRLLNWYEVQSSGRVGTLHMAIRSWIEAKGEGAVYVRYQNHVYEGARYDCFVLANINIFRTGKGHFTRILDFLEKEVPISLVVENALDLRLASFLNGRGYKMCGRDGPPFTMILLRPGSLVAKRDDVPVFERPIAG